MVHDALGPSLEDLRTKGPLLLQTVLLILDQLIPRFESIHKSSKRGQIDPRHFRVGGGMRSYQVIVTSVRIPSRDNKFVSISKCHTSTPFLLR
jgi:hypothetical protein